MADGAGITDVMKYGILRYVLAKNGQKKQAGQAMEADNEPVV